MGSPEAELQGLWNLGHQALRGSGAPKQESWLWVCARSCQTLGLPSHPGSKVTACILQPVCSAESEWLWTQRHFNVAQRRGTLRNREMGEGSIPNAGFLVSIWVWLIECSSHQFPSAWGFLFSFLWGKALPPTGGNPPIKSLSRIILRLAAHVDSPGALFVITTTWALARPNIIQILGQLKWKVYCMPGIVPGSKTLF